MIGALASTPTRASTEDFWTIPSEMRDRSQWVVWRWEMQNGKHTKMPYQCFLKTSRRAKVNDPSTWGTFGAAITVFELGGFDGLMYAVSADDPFVFVDLDHCRDPLTGRIDSWALDIIRTLSSYTELSPSGTGVHIFVRGALPPQGRKKGPIEMYDCLRFATMTGRRLEIIDE